MCATINLSGGGLGAADLKAGSVGTSEVAPNSLGAADLAPSSVGSDEVADESLNGVDILNGWPGPAELGRSRRLAQTAPQTRRFRTRPRR